MTENFTTSDYKTSDCKTKDYKTKDYRVMEKIRPTNITADRNERVLIIEWSDGKECRYPFAGLRAVCPCAECQGGHENMGRPADKELLYSAKDPELNMESLEQVGSYALGIRWSDGHWHGIYTWTFLYAACAE